jgi:hypothetical protein
MSRSYPIWNQVTACIYQSGKSYGAKETSEVRIFVGRGASLSELLVHHCTTKRERDGKVVYTFWVDGEPIKEAVFEQDKSGKLTHLYTQKVEKTNDH